MHANTYLKLYSYVQLSIAMVFDNELICVFKLNQTEYARYDKLYFSSNQSYA